MSNRPGWIVPVVVAGLPAALGGGLLATTRASSSGQASADSTGKGSPVTVIRKERETLPGTTVVTTAPRDGGSVPGNGNVSVDEAVQLTDQATGYLRQGDWTSALATERKSLGALNGAYPDDFRYEGTALAELGRCSQALRSEALRGQRSEIDDARARCSG